MSEFIITAALVFGAAVVLGFVPAAYRLGVSRGFGDALEFRRMDETITSDTRDTLVLGEADQQICGDDWGRYSRLEVEP